MNEEDVGTLAGALEQFALGLVTKEHAVEALRLRDYSELLTALGAAGFPLPTISEREMRDQVKTFCKVRKKS